MTEPVKTSDKPSAPPGRTPGGFEAWLFGAWVGALVALLIVFAFLSGRDDGKTQAKKDAAKTKVTQAAKPAPAKKPKAVAELPGQKIFVATCGGCHTLSEAGTNGAVGPNLDDLKPDLARVEKAIKIGGTGVGAMPPNLLQGAQATEVATYVSKVAGGQAP